MGFFDNIFGRGKAYSANRKYVVTQIRKNKTK